jgi:hypothetical protein
MRLGRQKGHVMRSRKWWLIAYRDVTLDGGAIVTKTKREKLTEVLPEHGRMLIPPASVLSAQREFMARINGQIKARLLDGARTVAEEKQREDHQSF